MRFHSRRPGFTLVELLIVIAIIAILLGMLVPAVQQVREAAYRIKTNHNLRQVALAAHTYNSTYDRLPAAGGHLNNSTFSISLMAQLLPFVEQEPLAAKISATTSVAELDLLEKNIVPVYLSPLDNSVSNNMGPLGFAAGNMVGNFNVFGNTSASGRAALTSAKPSIARSFPDGISNTVLFSTRLARCGKGGSEWGITIIYPYHVNRTYPCTSGAFFGATLPNAQGIGVTFQDQPTASNCDPEYAHAMSTGGLPVAMGDTSVRMVRADISGATWRAALLPADSVPLGADWDN